MTYEVSLSPIAAGPAPFKPDFSGLVGQHWNAPCDTNGGGGASCTEVRTPSAGTQLTGDGHFSVRARIRGVMEPNPTAMGTTNLFELGVDSPMQTIELNSGPSVGTAQLWDFTTTFEVDLPAAVAYLNAAPPGPIVEYANSAGLEIPGVTTSPAPYAGQFARLDLIDVAPMATASTWPAGVEVWTAPDATQTCLRATVGTATNFVVTPGDLDCDSFADTADCDPLRYCDPDSHEGCSATCTTKVKGQCLIGTCLDDAGASATAGRCVVEDDAKTYCLACDSGCDYTTSTDDASSTFACVAMQPDVTCPYQYYGTTTFTLCQAPLEIEVGGTASCLGAWVLNADPVLQLAVSIESMQPCVIDLQSLDTLPLSNNDLVAKDILIGLEATSGGVDTFTVQLMPVSVGGTTTDTCPMTNVCHATTMPRDCSL